MLKQESCMRALITPSGLLDLCELAPLQMYIMRHCPATFLHSPFWSHRSPGDAGQAEA